VPPTAYFPPPSGLLKKQKYQLDNDKTKKKLGFNTPHPCAD
jgi:hypothetical protein